MKGDQNEKNAAKLETDAAPLTPAILAAQDELKGLLYVIYTQKTLCCLLEVLVSYETTNSCYLHVCCIMWPELVKLAKEYTDSLRTNDSRAGLSNDTVFTAMLDDAQQTGQRIRRSNISVIASQIMRELA